MLARPPALRYQPFWYCLAVLVLVAVRGFAADGTVLPGKGVARHPFLYAGEWDLRNPRKQSMFVVRDGKVAGHYSIPLRNAAGGIQEFDDATMLSNGNIISSATSG